MKSSRGFVSKLSITWLAVLVVCAWHGNMLTAGCFGGLPWMLHRKFERRRSR